MNTFAMVVGYLCIGLIIRLCVTPILKGISSGLFKTILYYKVGCKSQVVLSQFIKSFTTDPYLWVVGVDSCESYSISGNCWRGIFKWSFDKELSRKQSLKGKT